MCFSEQTFYRKQSLDSPARWPSASEKEEKFASNDKRWNVYSDFVTNSHGESWDSSCEQGKQAKSTLMKWSWCELRKHKFNEEMIIAVVINSNLNHGDDHMFI